MPELPADLAAAGAELGLQISRIVRQTELPPEGGLFRRFFDRIRY